jgi:hypothetical protein
MNGSLTQYKPDLKEAKTISGPEGRKLIPISILWISTYQFIVACKDVDDPDARPGFLFFYLALLFLFVEACIDIL